MVSVLVPYRPDRGYRDRAWKWNRRRWEAMPDAELVVSIAPEGRSPAEFNHPLAINQAAERAKGNILVIADADTAFDPQWVADAANLVETGIAPWVLPRFYDKVGRRSSSEVLGADPLGPMPDYTPEWHGDSVSWSGLVVVSVEAFEAVEGYDERISWWGADDICFGLTMDALWGKHVRLEGSAVHLWHPQSLADTYGHERHAEQQALVDRYIAAAEDPEAIREVRFS